ncbi:MAG: cell division protein FtsA [Verrucomicrobiota bacterium]
MSGRVVAAIEIGSEEVKVLVGEIFDDESLNIIGRSQVESSGVTKGRVVNFREASDRVGEALDLAEQSAGANIESAYLAVAGPHLEGLSHPATTRVRSPDNRVAVSDVDRVNAEAKGKEISADRLFIHFIRNHYLLDGRLIENPVGFEGEELGVTYWLLHGDAQAVAEHIHVVNSQNIKVEDVIVASVASACMVATEEEKKAGCLVVDLGRGTTDYAFYRKGCIVRTGSIPVGGEHLTNDLSVGLRIVRDGAEDLKIKHGSATVLPEDKGRTHHLYGDLKIGDKSLYASSINRILEVRMEELFELIRSECGQSELKSGAVRSLLTGGGARLQRCSSLAERVFGFPSRVAENPEWVADELRGVEFSTVLGVLHYALEGQTDRMGYQSRQKSTGVVKKFSRLFR